MVDTKIGLLVAPFFSRNYLGLSASRQLKQRAFTLGKAPSRKKAAYTAPKIESWGGSTAHENLDFIEIHVRRGCLCRRRTLCTLVGADRSPCVFSPCRRVGCLCGGALIVPRGLLSDLSGSSPSAPPSPMASCPVSPWRLSRVQQSYGIARRGGSQGRFLSQFERSVLWFWAPRL